MTSTLERPVHVPELRQTEIVLLVAAPVVLGLGRALLVPFDDQRWDHMLTDMADHPTRNAIGWSLSLLAAGLLTATGLALVRLVSDRPRLAIPATIGVVTGWAGTAAIASGGLLMGDMAKNPDRKAMIDVLTGFNEGNGNTVFFMVLAGVIGSILLAVALARGGVASKGTAILIGAGAVISLIGAPGPVAPVAITGAVLLLAGHVQLLRGLRCAAGLQHRSRTLRA